MKYANMRNSKCNWDKTGNVKICIMLLRVTDFDRSIIIDVTIDSCMAERYRNREREKCRECEWDMEGEWLILCVELHRNNYITSIKIWNNNNGKRAAHSLEDAK